MECRADRGRLCRGGAKGEGAGVEGAPERIGATGEAELAHLAVEADRWCTDPLGEGPLGGPRLELELEQPITDVQTAKGPPSVEVRGGKEVGDPSAVGDHGERGREGGQWEVANGGSGLVGHTPD